MKKVAIKVQLEQEIWLDEETWENKFSKELPTNMDEVNDFQENCLMMNIEFRGSEFIDEWETFNKDILTGEIK